MTFGSVATSARTAIGSVFESVGSLSPNGWPWTEPPGRFSPFKTLVFAALFVPAAGTAYGYLTDALGARPLIEANHQTGLWMIRFFLLALAITPLRQILQWPRLLLVRRMIGVAAFAYGLAHISLYTADEKFALGTVGSEIVLRIYLTIGFTALVGLGLLAATSTDGMVRRLGARRWRNLHRLGYGIGVLACIHYFMQSKADVWEATWIAGLFGWLIGYRVLAALTGRKRRVPLSSVGLLSIGAAALTAFGEAAYYWWKLGIAPSKVLAFDLTFSLALGPRPTWIVLAVGLVVTAAGVAGAIARRYLQRRTAKVDRKRTLAA